MLKRVYKTSVSQNRNVTTLKSNGVDILEKCSGEIKQFLKSDDFKVVA